MYRNSIGYSHQKYALSGLALTALAVTCTPVHADQQFENIILPSAIDPFDPSETVTHNLKDDIRLRLKLPAPDLPISVVETQQSVSGDQEVSNSPKSQSTSEEITEPGILGKSFSTVMSIFDWSDDSEIASKAPMPEKSPEESNGPIRINVHVGIKKPETQPTAETSDSEVSSLQTPWTRNQARVRQFFTFGEIKTHE